MACNEMHMHIFAVDYPKSRSVITQWNQQKHTVEIIITN